MRKIEITPEALNDLGAIKEYLDSEYGQKKEKEILKSILKDIRRLEKYPQTDIKLFERFGIETDYKCIYTNQNYVFYRLENSTIRIIRILSNKRDFLYVLFGTRMNSEESEEYWEE
ncbi:MAG: type II toxin-antitoxin system RelE/ParE family toxin [Lachnospiraceae bacterium]|nr:type II toxin-antitoxin system RelE/ParE family toxin [Lachnospiraceae bacterium]